ncbi:tyrosine-type recombinase/integrase [Halomonas sp. GFAJ-1]|uniref:tyrosine-type recombinase/integrase n=1 Tax=Halomonas sp. GFAJ-1 TaxID=1118153 RepID=UPI00023A4691|nr:site-specific integrase [Halomonas sp. GFAJ-1]AVI62920.1 hypothetical protein BB497_09530 [Halomonas sp. GFAJ-1]EHK62041.1 hypothetical protein MOY_03448 [Halomonas sp. GFAJ-1]
MELLNAERLISEWKEANHPLTQASQLSDTTHILSNALGDTPIQTLKLEQPDVLALIERFFEWRQATERSISRRQARDRVNRVLTALNLVPGMQSVLMPEPIAVHRPSALPTTPRSFSMSEQMIALEVHLLPWCRKRQDIDAWLMLLAIRLMTRTGMSETVMLGTLAMLSQQHINGRELAIPSSPHAQWPDDGHYRITLHDDVWIPIRALTTRLKRKNTTTWLFDISEDAESLNYKERRKQLRQRLKTTVKQCLTELRSHPDSHEWYALRHWSSVVSASRYVDVVRGTPPLWSTLLRQYPLPTCTPVPLLAQNDDAHQYAPGASMGRLPDRVSNHNQTPAPIPEAGSTTRPAGVYSFSTQHLPIDWQRRAKNLLRQFLAEAARLNKKKVVAKKHTVDMQTLLERYEKRLKRLIGHRGHYPDWILQFLYYQLRTEGNTLSTARTQLSRLTPITMLLHEAVLDLSDWDDDVVLELQMEAQSGAQWSARTLESFKISFRQFIRFCQQHGMLEDVSLPKKQGGTLAPSVLRTRILSPDHMQLLWNTLTNNVPDGDPRQMMGLVIALGFYGGLRASEVESLTLNSIIFSDANEQSHRNCWVEILGGKTAAARRRVALHIMAPPSVIQCMHRWVNTRLSECSQWSLTEAALFGPRHSPETYTRKSLIQPVIEWMRYMLGEDIDFHGLRHAAVSWTLLRLHAAQHPHFRNTLQHRHHWMFQPEPLQKILEHFCGAEGRDTLARGTLLLQVTKWIGHREPGTLLENYAHTLGLIHSDILAPKPKN